ncbi:hypothetical protein Glove_48g68 [Diversispora epigaea]|uniref:Uncharacterized protein n=1 Tax=Diversispora epigaea TaxID=1348612 RepID=A0A397JEC0_9GLOM|nr:hypothetical protein Glove_48g68 [Diversispora epigaea]
MSTNIEAGKLGKIEKFAKNVAIIPIGIRYAKAVIYLYCCISVINPYSSFNKLPSISLRVTSKVYQISAALVEDTFTPLTHHNPEQHVTFFERYFDANLCRSRQRTDNTNVSQLKVLSLNYLISEILDAKSIKPCNSFAESQLPRCPICPAYIEITKEEYSLVSSHIVPIVVIMEKQEIGLVGKDSVPAEQVNTEDCGTSPIANNSISTLQILIATKKCDERKDSNVIKKLIEELFVETSQISEVMEESTGNFHDLYLVINKAEEQSEYINQLVVRSYYGFGKALEDRYDNYKTTKEKRNMIYLVKLVRVRSNKLNLLQHRQYRHRIGSFFSAPRYKRTM